MVKNEESYPMKKRILAFFCACCLLLCGILPLSAEEAETSGVVDLQINATSVILMEYETGRVLYEQNADEPLPPASITKIMTLLLVMEAIEAEKITWEEPVTASERAAAMGGSQIYLKAGEQMSVRDLVKSVVIASANDAAAALAEHLCGSIEAFVEQMNQKAAELSMQNTHFENTNGLDDTTTAHYTSARDVALMSRALMRHQEILTYSSTWMDSVRDGAFGLTNTNRLVRFYPGATGLKTGSTAKAKYCISATAMRDDMHLIAVVMGAPTRDIRNEEAKKLLDYGFANYAVYSEKIEELEALPVKGGVADFCRIKTTGFSALVEKGQKGKIKKEVHLPDYAVAPLRAGEKVGTVAYYADGQLIGEADIVACEEVGKISFGEILFRLFRSCFGIKV